ncbi:tRNA (adenosine(37)-N6)-dimethylallyltransferase MiaA [Opitutales bacterium ASA1]|uniref:tRNA (adenosine(37)-N6)-dimethylallyltransferase MiaA n=1 Tax=Congregicoccus parvus TaxID=3081749 RepID=UPI002B2A0291|nr:tRNA (adenosine(37)-N6)-dimethylallyltransferase MiaA [Opitutales bacterium ASA1]
MNRAVEKAKTLHLLTGCTACGKTEVSLRWAERFGAEIVSCDALLFYRGMDIGTAKPTAEERARVMHHLVDVVEPTERMNVKEYSRLARAAVDAIEARGREVLVVGGSGFYLKSFLAAVADDVAVDPGLRDRLEKQARDAGLDTLVEELTRLNPEGLGGLDVRNPRRVVRALERCLASGRSLAELAEDLRCAPRPFPGRRIRLVELARESGELRERIRRRVDAMSRDGLVEEVRALRERGFEANPTAAQAVGYRETLTWLDAGAANPEALAEAITRSTNRLARKQRTWFRGQLPAHKVVWIKGSDPVDVDDLFEGADVIDADASP